MPTWCATLAAICPTAASCSARASASRKRKDALVAVDELRVAQPQLGGRFVDALLQRVVKVLQPPQHVVEACRDAADFVGTRPFGAGGEISRAGARHRVANERDGPMNQPASEPVDQQRQQDDGRRREPERDLPAFRAQLIEGGERDGRDRGGMGSVGPDERHGDRDGARATRSRRSSIGHARR